MQTFEEDGYYVKLIVNDEVVSKEKAINADGVQDFRLYQGCKGTSGRPVTKESMHKCEAINVYIDNVVVETSQDQNIRPDIPDEIEGTPELVGDGNCIDGWTPIFGKCFPLGKSPGLDSTVRCQFLGGLPKACNASLQILTLPIMF